MAVAIVPKFTKAQITAFLAKKKEAIEKAVMLRLKRVGETFITNARNNGAYKDRTGNLRSSIGYVILKNGEQVYQAFPGKKGEGKTKAKEVIEAAIADFPLGYVLIVVAGMEYAAAVESKGFDVLSGSSKIAEQDLKLAMQQIKLKADKLT